MTSLTINGEQADLSLLWRPERGLNRIRREWRQARFSLLVEATAFLSALSANYESCVLDLKHDDSLTGETDFFGEAGYPSPSQLVEQPELLARVVDTFFAEQVFMAVLPPPPAAFEGSYAIGGIDSIASLENAFAIQGPCYAYPD
ncbi:hypothetical protein AACH06_29875 [Ideonella sp. DXS29W]|uniref:Uncharacterized protein n=1 Tax=Ideonella lacteola TaxID=2984193 RepID=A0ABU9BYQ7_9BURK